jgi:CDP-paratose 2-epimerase
VDSRRKVESGTTSASISSVRKIIVTGSAGLIGSETVKYFAREGYVVVGIDNDMRSRFFGAEASTAKTRDRLVKTVRNYSHHDIDIRNASGVLELFRTNQGDIAAVVHTAAQPSHDWAARDPQTDFTVNANGTLNLLEAAREVCPEAPFVFTSTNKVYGDTPNRLPLRELPLRWEIAEGHEYEPGISETMSIDCTKHSLFGASKAAADILVQEYGRYFGMPTACFRGGCLTGPAHAGTELHGFLSYLMICTVTGRPYRVFGYGGKQVRDNIHSADLVDAFAAFIRAPRAGEVYNIGGSRHSNCSMLEAINLCEEISGRRLSWKYEEGNRIGDHIWWISDVRKFQQHYPNWKFRYGQREILEEIYRAVRTSSSLQPETV